MGNKLDVIIPVYNQEQLVLKALDSVPRLPSIGVIVINDGSTDTTLRQLLDYQNEHPDLNMEVLHNPVNKGVAYTVNRGIDNSVADYIVLLGSDDYLYTDQFIQVVEQIDGTDLIYFNLETNDGTILRVTEETKMDLCGSVKLMRREFVGSTRNDTTYKAGKDYHFYRALLEKNPTEKFTDIIAKHYNYPREQSLTWLTNNKKRS